MRRVAIFGGGVAGLSAAHELSERGFDVTVYEARRQFGGKARSLPVPGSGTGGRSNLPAEHGFRFFPGFYWHVTDTMKRIPTGTGTVYDRLTTCREILMAQADGKNEIIAPAGIPTSWSSLVDALRALRSVVLGTGVPVAEFAVFVERMLVMMMSCDERRLSVFEKMSWWDFVEANSKSPAYQKFLATGMTRTLVAAKAEEMSARTGGTVLCQMIYDMLQLDNRVDNVLSGPTSEVWIDPWTALLERRGVRLRTGCAVSGLRCDSGRITAAVISTESGDETVDADFYISAVPIEKFIGLVSPAMRAADPRMGGLHRLRWDWMTGLMFYLDEDVPLEHGHAIFIDSEWALTAISQRQFWPSVDLEQRGDGRVEGVLSVDISAWDVPGPVTGKVAKACTPDEIRQEVWAQLIDHIDDGSLDEANVVAWFLDPAIEFHDPGSATNSEPLLINTKCSWADRPDAVTALPNLFLAADFVRTNTDLATMEGANEAARAAVNGILEATGYRGSHCEIRVLREPWVFMPFRFVDRLRWKLRRAPSPPPFRVTAAGDLVPTGAIGRACVAALRYRRNSRYLGVPRRADGSRK